ncbi:MAG TPA: hypothetical protein VFV72_05935 [Candidatus Limnocylindrales bacterium]|nr:hypothetical protein [Candidatus Limnocylindrales bacterium]
MSWWADKVRQFRAHLTARVAPSERRELAAWLSPSELALYDSMHVADRRHGLDVVATLREDGVTENDLLVAGLLHDAGKGNTGVVPRVVFSLGQHYGAWVWRVASVIPGWDAALVRLASHAETSAALAKSAGCSERTVALIRYQDAPRDPEFGELLRLADEAN